MDTLLFREKRKFFHPWYHYSMNEAGNAEPHSGRLNVVVLILNSIFFGVAIGLALGLFASNQRVEQDIPIIPLPETNVAMQINKEKECTGQCNLLGASSTPLGRKFVVDFKDRLRFSIDYPVDFKINSYHDWNLEGGVMMTTDKYPGVTMYIEVMTAKGWATRLSPGEGVYYDWLTDGFFKDIKIKPLPQPVSALSLGKTVAGKPIFAFSELDKKLWPGATLVILHKEIIEQYGQKVYEPIIIVFSDFGIGSGSLPTADAIHAFMNIIKSAQIEQIPSSLLGFQQRNQKAFFVVNK